MKAKFTPLNFSSKITPKKKEEIGLSPFDLVFRGEKRASETSFRIMQFDKDNLFETDPMKNLDLELLNSDRMTWLHVSGLHEVEKIREISDSLQIPNNIISSVLDTHIRPRMESFENGLYISLKLLMYNEEEDIVSVQNVSFIVLEKILLSFREDQGKVFEIIRERIRNSKNKIRIAGSDYLAFALMDVVLDNYVYVMGSLGEKIEIIDEEMSLNPARNILDKINAYKREINFIRRNILPAKELILNLLKTDSDIIHKHNMAHFRELQNNIHEAVELSETYREVLYDQMNIFHTSVSTKLNDIMKILTLFSVIFIPLTFIAGVYGMNFDNMPELHLKYGYFIILGLMAVVAVLMFVYFIKKKWF